MVHQHPVQPRTKPQPQCSLARHVATAGAWVVALTVAPPPFLCPAACNTDPIDCNVESRSCRNSLGVVVACLPSFRAAGPQVSMLLPAALSVGLTRRFAAIPAVSQPNQPLSAAAAAAQELVC